MSGIELKAPKNQIRIKGAPIKKSVRRQVERYLEKWLFRQKRLFFLPDPVSSVIHFDKESESLTLCSIDIQISSWNWTSREQGRSPWSAFLKAMKNLKRQSTQPLSYLEQSSTAPSSLDLSA